MRLQLLSAMICALAIVGSTKEVRCAESAQTKADLLTNETSRVPYYLSLPKNWNPESTWPILVTIDGVGHDFRSNVEAFVRARGDRPFIIVTPWVKSNGRDEADLKAVLEIVKEVQTTSKGQPKFFITGFSAGGHLMWQCVFENPELLAGVAPAAANFGHRGIYEISKAPERRTLPIHEFLGEKDAYKKYLDEQWAEVSTFAREKGYENLKFTQVPGAGHEAFPDQVISFFASLIPKKK